MDPLITRWWLTTRYSKRVKCERLAGRSCAGCGHCSRLSSYPSKTRRDREEPGLDNADFIVRFWGVRGSIACPGPSTARYGGNTSCVEVRCGDQLFIFDG